MTKSICDQVYGHKSYDTQFQTRSFIIRSFKTRAARRWLRAVKSEEVYDNVLLLSFCVLSDVFFLHYFFLFLCILKKYKIIIDDSVM